MLIVNNILVSNFEGAMRGMRNPLNSWKKTDSIFEPKVTLGPNDLSLAQRLIKSGPDHGKFLRQIFVSMDITAPLYWWKEMDTYKVGTVANSTSTMHKLATTPISKELFSFDDDLEFLTVDKRADERETLTIVFDDVTDELIYHLEQLRRHYLKTKNPQYWRALVQLLPNGWNQTRTWTANYQVLRNIYFARKNHKLSEWHTFCEEIKKLPYSKELITIQKEEKEYENS